MGKELKAEIIEMEGQKVKLSITAAQRSEERADLEAWKATQKPQGGGKAGFGTLADKLKGLKRDLGKLEQTILDVQTRKHALEAQLSGHPAADKIAELGRELAQVDASLNTHEEQWLLLSEEIEEGRALYKSRVAPNLYQKNFYDRALVDILIKSKGHVKSKIW